MSFFNTATDLTLEETRAIEAAGHAASALARAGTPTVTQAETDCVGRLLTACKGRGIERPLQILLDHYRGASTSSPVVAPTTAARCGALENKPVGTDPTPA